MVLFLNERAHTQTSLLCESPLSFTHEVIAIMLCCYAGLTWAVLNYCLVRRIDVLGGYTGEEEVGGKDLPRGQRQQLVELGKLISDGAIEFLKQQYCICMGFAVLMAVLTVFLTQEGIFTAVAFIVGALVSILAGSIGMYVGTQTNYKVTYCAKNSISSAFRTAYRAGCAMGFSLVSLGLLILILLIILFKFLKNIQQSATDPNYYNGLFEAIAGYGFGGSFVALFGRVGGGIYTKAADVGADLVGKIETGLPEDSPKNPATIADNVGDNVVDDVGDIAGMSADLFGSFAESTCAALVLSSNTLRTASCPFFLSNFMYPLMLIGFGIVLCIVVSTISTHCSKVDSHHSVQNALKTQLIVSTVLLIGVIFLAAYLTFPSTFQREVDPIMTGLTIMQPAVCSIMGLVSGVLIAIITEYVTSHNYAPVRELAESCKSGAGSNVTLGLSLGYMSTLLPVIFIAITAFMANHLLGYYGVALAALGMLANLPLSLAIDGFGPISDNAGGIAQMAEMGEEVRDRTDGLDAAGNTTAAIGKGFAIGSATLVSLALYGGFLHNAGLQAKGSLSLNEPSLFAGLLLGAMLPYIFSALTIRSVSKAAQGMVAQVRRQIKAKPGILDGSEKPDYNACIAISTRASLYEMIIPGLMVIFTPLIIGFVFGVKMLSGFLLGAIVSGVQMAISAANTGGAWDNAKKYIESGAMLDDRGVKVLKGSQIHKAAVVGDTVGDPLKDTSGPALNILMKIMAIIALIFGSKMAKLSLL